MKQTRIMRIMAMILTTSIIMSLAGCGTNTKPATTDEVVHSVKQKTTDPSENMITSAEELTDTSVATEPEDTTPPTKEAMEKPTESTAEIPPEEQKDEYGLTKQQRNSFSMLYYLAITAEEIRISKNNRLILDDIYTSLLNDINPGAIDEITQDHLKNLRDIINTYINISVKRDRLQYIYNQDKAAAIRSAVPDPLAILSMTNSFNWKKLATSVVYTVVNSYSNYKSANETADQEFLMSGWELDDEEMAAIQKNRERAFDYMVDIVQKYGLDGKLTLNEKAIENFAEICAIESVQQKIRRLESEESTYKLLGNYWLELAACYYETSQYQECLDCVDRYNELAIGIYRKDYNYVQILPKVIVAAQEVYSGDDYVTNIEAFADSIIENTTTEEWSVRYFAAQVYLDLYAKTNNHENLETAYNIAYDNVTILLDEQCSLNETYLSDVKELTIKEPNYRIMTEDEKKDAEKEYKAELKRLKAYNKALQKDRESELPVLYEPLILNCDLLFALADEMNISSKDQEKIEAILQTDSNGVFLVKPINDRYSFSAEVSDYSIDFNKNEIIIPAYLLTADSEIVVVAKEGDKSITFDDCIVTKVERGNDFDNFLSHVSSKSMDDYKWTANSKVTVKIINDDENDPLLFQFKVVEFKKHLFFSDKVVFEE